MAAKRARTGKDAGQGPGRGLTGGSGSPGQPGAGQESRSLRALLDEADARKPGLVAATDPYAPASVAVYRMFNLDGALLYVGISDDPKRRFAQHAHDKGWWYLVVRWTVEWYPDRASAAAEEARAIVDEAPAYNVAGVPTEVVDERARWEATLAERAPTLSDLNALFLELVTARSFSSHLWPTVRRRRWEYAQVQDVYIMARNQATRWTLMKHRWFVEDWNAAQEADCRALQAVQR